MKWLLLLLLAQFAPQLHYEVLTITQFDAKPVTAEPTRVQITGWVTYKHHENDGDWHLRLCESKETKGMNVRTCVVAEIMPDLPVKGCDLRHCSGVKVGEQLTLRGISRYDGEHKWREVHPVEAILP